MKNYFSVPEAAQICAVNRSTMLRWANSGKIKFYMTPGGHRRILKQDLKKWLIENGLPYQQKDFVDETIKILIVDDDQAVRSYLKKILNGVFVEIKEAFDGFDAGKKIVGFKPDLIILDLYMPNMDGFSLCRNIKNDPVTCRIKILVLSGHGASREKTRALESGADLFLDKPSSRKKIISSIETLLKSNQKNKSSSLFQGTD